MNILSPPISSVFFDYDGTLRENEPRGADVFQEFAIEYGLEIGDERRFEAERWLHYYWAQSDELLRDLELYGGSDNGDFWRQHARRQLTVLGASQDNLDKLSEQLVAKMQEDYQPRDKIADDVHPTLKYLVNAGYVLGVVSNREGGLSVELEKFALAQYFETVIAAGEVGWWKPDPRLLRHAINLAGLQSSETAYVGDNYYADVLGAEAAGLQAVLLDPLDLYASKRTLSINALGELLALLPESHN